MRWGGRLVGLLLVCLAPTVQADEQAAWKALREGRAVLLMRHAQAPGLGDPAGFRLDDCRTQRNLDARGRRQAQLWGEQLRRQGIPRPRLFSSRWCRALETARELDLGAVQAWPALDSFFAERDRQGAQTAALRQAVNGLPAGQATVLVSHQVNITALTGVYPASGEALILAWPLGEPPAVLARIPPP